MNPLCESLVEADEAAAEVLAALERLRAAVQLAYDSAAARGLPLALDLGPMAGRVERVTLDLARDVRRVVAPHAKAIRSELECVV